MIFLDANKWNLQVKPKSFILPQLDLVFPSPIWLEETRNLPPEFRIFVAMLLTLNKGWCSIQLPQTEGQVPVASRRRLDASGICTSISRSEWENSSRWEPTRVRINYQNGIRKCQEISERHNFEILSWIEAFFVDLSLFLAYFRWFWMVLSLFEQSYCEFSTLSTNLDHWCQEISRSGTICPILRR